MKAILKKAALAAALVTASLSANAAESHITVYTSVDLTLALLKADGSALPDEVHLVHIPGQGLSPHTERVRIFTNDTNEDVEVRLGAAPSLRHVLGAGPDVPLSASLNGRTLTAAAQDFTAAELWPGASGDQSIAMDFTIAQATRAPINVAGNYQGMVSVILNQKP